jgi:RNA polymerase sigma-70 factor (ECF subfamily)
VAQARRGDRAAFGELYDRYLPSVYARVCALVPRTDAEDVTQDVFVSVARSIHTFRGDSAFATWVHTIVRRRAADYHRRAARRVQQVPLDEEGDAGSDEPLGTVEEELAVKRLLLALPERQREVILLRLVEGLPFAEVAARLGIRVGAAKVRYYRAIAACRERLG